MGSKFLTFREETEAGRTGTAGGPLPGTHHSLLQVSLRVAQAETAHVPRQPFLYRP